MLVGVAMGVFIFLLLAEKLTLSLCGVILPFIIVNEREKSILIINIFLLFKTMAFNILNCI